MPAGNPSGGGIARAAGTVMAAFVLSRALGLAREIVISSRFGTSGELDAYLAAFRIPDLLFQLMAGGALASAFIPTFAGLLASDDEAGAWRLANSVINALAMGLGVVALICLALAGPLARHVVAVGFDPERQALTASLMRIMLLAPIAFSVSGVFMGVLNSYGRFLAPALAPSAYNLAIIIGAAFLSPEIGAFGLALGVAVGSVAHYVIQLPQVLTLMPEELAPGPAEHGILGLRSPHVREVVRLMIPRSVGLAAVQVNFLVNTILASTLAPGSLAVLNYAWMLMLLPQGIFAQGVATAAFPALSSLAAQKRWDELADLFLRSTRGVLFLALPATVGLMVLGEPIVTLVLGRGAFDSQAAAAVARVLFFYALGLTAHSVLEVLTRAFYATHDTRTPVAVGVTSMGLNVLLSLALRGPLQESGLALANTVAVVVEVALLWAILSRRLPAAGPRALLESGGRILAAALLMGAVLLVLARVLPGSLAVVALVGMALGAAVYGVGAFALGVPEARAALDRVWRQISRQR
ncbi:MAG: murein biosynthesis integral membrane protein MurJ [Anaerolineae bacterium]|nr:murein biosynthesis integral membrane protein MurJ [Anaerolineae bacterium]